MDHARFDGLTRSFGTASRRDLGGVLAGGGLGALLGSAFGARDVAAKKSKKKKAKPGASGPAGSPGPTGPAGAPGPPGAPGAPLSLVALSGERSAVLGAGVGSEVESIAECGLGSIPLTCSWAYIGNASDFDRTTTQVGSGSFRGVGSCTARLRRTATVGNAGGQIIVSAICTRSEPSQSS